MKINKKTLGVQSVEDNPFFGRFWGWDARMIFKEAKEK
jgi:hypothetical protein